MSSQGLSIAIRADTTGLSQGFAAALAQTQAFASAINAVGAQMANAFQVAGNASRGQASATRAAAEAARQAAAEEIAAEKNAAGQIAAIRRSNLDTTLALSKQQLAAQKQDLAQELATHQITAQQKYDASVRLATQEEKLEEDAEHDAERADGATLASRVENVNKIKLLEAQLVTELGALKRQETADAKSENERQLESWQATVSEITSAESELVSDIFNKRQSLVKDLAQVGYRMVQDEVTNCLKILTEKELYNALGLQSDKTTAEEGLLYKLGAYLADKTGLIASEESKTEVITMSVAARTTAESAGAAAGKAAQALDTSQTIAQDAASAASGTWAAVSQIPIVGPFLAPAAAGAAYAAVMAYDSFDHGAWDLPHDMFAQVHKGETILNASEASDFRSVIAGAGRGAMADGGNVTNNHFHFSPELTGTVPRNALEELSNAQDAFAGLIQGMVRSGRLKVA